MERQINEVLVTSSNGLKGVDTNVIKINHTGNVVIINFLHFLVYTHPHTREKKLICHMTDTEN